MAKNISKKIEDFAENIIKERLEEVVSDRFGTYSKYIIQDRALPNVKDGLKPVQRRILYGMYKMGMFANKPYKKSARIVGEVMGKYHPHGDTSIYDAMVRLSQDWKTNMLLVDMHGNNGSIDGDGPAAMRYTEARMSVIAEELLKDINKNTVDFIPNFDDEEYEPLVLPSKFPNILVNGSTGISSGYATNIPPHNLHEVIKATIFRIDNPHSSIEELMEYIKGPDFPTGGIIQGKQGIIDAYKTGSGKILIRSKTVQEAKRIIITEIPYEVNKAQLVRKIDEIRANKKVQGISEVRDESDRDGLRIVIDLKKDSNVDLIMNYLLKSTDLQKNYSFNMVAINNKRPMQMGLEQILDAYITHQKDVITNRSNYELEKANKRLHIVDGLIKMVDVVDEVIATIRKSNDKSDAKVKIEEEFGFTELQAEAIVTLQLYRLSNTDITALQKEAKQLSAEIRKLTSILKSEEMLKVVIKAELEEIMFKIETPRLSNLQDEVEEIKIQEHELIKEEEVIVSTTVDGYVKQTSIRSYQASEEDQCGVKEDDAVNGVYETNTLSTLLAFTNKGNYLFIPVYKLPDEKWKTIGTHISNLVTIDQDEKVIYTTVVNDFDRNSDMLIATKNGLIKRTKLSNFLVQRFSKKIKAIRLKKDDEVVSVELGYGEYITVYTAHGAVNKYSSDQVSEFGINAAGMASINIKNRENDYVVKAMFNEEGTDSLLLTSRGNIVRISIDELQELNRNRKPHQITNYIKSNPHDVVDVLKLYREEYKANIPLTVQFDGVKAVVEAFSIKYSTSGNGKNFVDPNIGEIKSISKVTRTVDHNEVVEIIREESNDVENESLELPEAEKVVKEEPTETVTEKEHKNKNETKNTISNNIVTDNDSEQEQMILDFDEEEGA